MRTISGFERPWVQWTLVALGIVLVMVASASAMRFRRAVAEIARLRAERLDERVQREQAEGRLARERAAREAFALELARKDATPRAVPTLTIAPLRARGAVPPAASVKPPAPDQLVELRLVLPREVGGQHYQSFQIVMRTWSEGTVVLTRGRARAAVADGQAMISVLIAGEVFVAGAYEIALAGTTADGQQREVAAYEVTIG